MTAGSQMGQQSTLNAALLALTPNLGYKDEEGT